MKKPKHHHSDRDRIWTPLDLAEKLISKVPIKKNDTICDPCLGKGAFYHQFPTQNLKFWYEIDKNKDFLTSNKKYDWCITNIPFSLPNDFIFKMAECSEKGFGILCLSNSMTVTRLKRLEEEFGFYPQSITEIYVKSWGFGYKTCFYVFGKKGVFNLESIIV